MSFAPLDADLLSQSDYRILAEHAPDIIARFDRDMRLLYINPAVENLTGAPRDELLGSPAEQLPFPPELLNIFRKRCLKVFQTGELNEVDLILPGANGARHFSTRIVPMKDETGATVSVLTLSRDVTERVQSEERQRFLAEFSARLVESPDYDSTLTNLANLMVEMMAEACAIDLAGSDGTLHRATLAAKNANVYVPDASDHTVTPTCISLPLKARGRTLGRITLVADEKTRVYDEMDLGFATELAARASIIVDNSRLYQEARNASMAKSAFLATMSHELRTPLNAILGYTELMELGVAGPVNAQQTQQLERISASAWHLLSVIEEILTFSRVEAGREETRIEVVPLRDLLREAAAMIEPIANRKSIEFHTEVIGESHTFRSDRGKVRQILLNLLSNAVKFTEAGCVSCIACVQAHGVEFTVEDTGVGIAPEHIDRVFDPFFQVAQGSTRKAGGTGLGLTVSRQLAQLLGGDVHVFSTPGAGSTFKVFIPTAIATT